MIFDIDFIVEEPAITGVYMFSMNLKATSKFWEA
jgi:hypothetical protein